MSSFIRLSSVVGAANTGRSRLMIAAPGAALIVAIGAASLRTVGADSIRNPALFVLALVVLVLANGLGVVAVTRVFLSKVYFGSGAQRQKPSPLGGDQAGHLSTGKAI